ncbi:MAG: type ISP restriction/modification enzyme [Chitinophagaceae bacterium]
MNYFETYFKELQSKPFEEITEHSHRTSLENLLNAIASKQNNKLLIIQEAKRTSGFGVPDFKVTNTGSIVGYVENKKIDEKLTKIINSNQIKKYKALRDNILLTNYIEFVLLKGDEVTSKTLCTEWDLLNRNTKLNDKNVEEVEGLILEFFSEPPLKIATAKKLADALAIRAKYLKDILKEELELQHRENRADKLMGLYETFKENIFHELTIDEFADAFAQTLAYGLFLAKLNADTKTITLNNAKEFIAHNFELIRELVDFLDELKNPQYSPTKWIVEEVLTIMNNLDLPEIQRSLFYRTKKTTDLFGETDFNFKDPFIYFYEDFLAAYDKKLRKSKGVYYTPPPIVNFIVRAIDDILKSSFNIKAGLADMNKVTVLDFATGTGTFLVDIIQRILDTEPANTAQRRKLVKDHILKNLYGFEYLIAPYTIAHLKLSQYLKDAGYPLQNGERLNVFLTNTLEPADKQIKIKLLPALSQETRSAQEVKEKKILVITGNPPYAGHSKNPSETKLHLKKGDAYTKSYRWNTTTNKTERVTATSSKEGDYTVKTWIGEKLMDYFFVDGKPLGERNPKWLQDDYVKFIRFAQTKMDKEDEGIVGIITNHSFLDNPTFRGMRQSLMNSFDQMYFIDLHGNNKKKEKTPEGNRDENVFDIEQGVAISILIKKKGLVKKIFHTDWWGTRETKYKNGWEEELRNIKWNEINAEKLFYFFHRTNTIQSNYHNHFKLTEIFKIYSVGIITARDEFTIKYTREEVWKTINQFLILPDEKAREAFKLGKDARDWKVHLAKKDLLQSEINFDKIIPISYRPFDIRFTYYTGNSRGFHCMPRSNVMKNMLYNNLAIIASRQMGKNNVLNAFISDNINEGHSITTGTSITYCFPLKLFLSDNGSFNFNFSEKILKFINELHNSVLTPEQILGYIYAILHSPAYRTKYAEFLKIDFPRIPFTEDKNLFEQLSNLGWQLIEAHLMKEDALHNIPGKFYCTDNGNYEVEKPVFNNEKLFINKQQYVYPVSKQVYEFYIGGYQVLDKYLKDRKGRKLNHDEAVHLSNIVKVIDFTIEQMKRIDALTKNWI